MNESHGRIFKKMMVCPKLNPSLAVRIGVWKDFRCPHRPQVDWHSEGPSSCLRVPTYTIMEAHLTLSLKLKATIMGSSDSPYSKMLGLNP